MPKTWTSSAPPWLNIMVAEQEIEKKKKRKRKKQKQKGKKRKEKNKNKKIKIIISSYRWKEGSKQVVTWKC